MWTDVNYALRAIGTKPFFYAMVILTLALGIGANTAIFSVVNAVLLRPLPYPDPERLMVLWTYNPRQGYEKDVSSYPNFADWQRASRSFERISAYTAASHTLTGNGDPVQLRGARVTHEFFDTIGVAPVHGRRFTAANGEPGGARVVMLGHGLWTRRFGSDPGIVGRQIALDGVSHEVVGVMPAGFAHPSDADYWVPLAPVGRIKELYTARGGYWLTVTGRLRPGVLRASAQAEMDTIAAALAKEHRSNAGIGIRIVPLHEELVGNVRWPLLLLVGAVSFVLLIACANVANLLLTRAASRRRELAIRAALGAGRGRLIRQLLTESIVVGLAGGCGGLLLAQWTTDLLRSLAPAGLPRMSDVGIDGYVFGYAAVTSLVTSILFGTLPALQASRGPLTALKDGGRSASDGATARRVHSMLAVGELAIALVLLVGAGVLIRSLVALNRVDPGFATTGVLTLQLQLPAAKYDAPERMAMFYEQLVERLAALPGVESAAAGTSVLLWQGPGSGGINIEGRPAPPPDVLDIPVPYDSVTPDFFSTLQIPLRRGRMFTRLDTAESQLVAIVNESFARRFFPGEDPLGRRVTFDNPQRTEARWQTIVGVVADTKRGGLEQETRAEVYFPMRQSPDRNASVLLRARGDAAGLTNAAQAAVWSIDRDQAIGAIQTVRQLFAEQEANRRFTTALLASFAGLAVVLAIIGIYGVIAYATAQRTQEIGIRMALGADRASVARTVLVSGLRIAATGLAIGLLGALLLTRLLGGLVFDVGARDPLTFVVAPAALLLVALAACWIPARRAMRVDPALAVRGDA